MKLITPPLQRNSQGQEVENLQYIFLLRKLITLLYGFYERGFKNSIKLEGSGSSTVFEIESTSWRMI